MTTEEFRKIAVQIPPSHPDTEWSFRQDCIRNRFLLYDGRKNKAVCTHCGYRWDIGPGEYSHMHGRKDICPECTAELICASAGKGRQYATEYHRVMTFASDGKNLWIVQNNVVVRFDDFDKAQIYRDMLEVFRISADSQQHWRRHYEWWSTWQREPAREYWDELKSFNPAPLPRAPYSESAWSQHIFTCDIDEIIANSDCRYLAGPDLHRALNWPRVTSWIANQMKYSALELLRKGGFGTLAERRLDGRDCNGNYKSAMNIRAKSIEKALKLPGKWVKALRKTGISEKITSYQLKEFQMLSEDMKQVALDNFEVWSEFISEYRRNDYIRRITKYTTLDKFFAYMTAQGKKDAHWYIDYIKNAERLGWDLRRKRILFPPDLQAAHDEAAKQYDAEKNAINDSLIASHAIDLDYTINNLIAVCARSQHDLNNESGALHHCVKTYGGDVAEGKTMIYFVRMADQADTPYYTLEISPRDGHVIQCRGMKNCSMTPEVKEFKDGFEKAFKKMLREGDKRCRVTA